MIVLIIRYWYTWLAPLVATLYFFALGNPENSILLAGGYTALLVVVYAAMYAYLYRTHKHRFVIGITLLLVGIGMTGLFLLVDSAIIRRFVSVMAAFLFAGIFHIPKRLVAQLAHEYKPWRRMFASIISVSMFSILTLLFGLDTFFQFPSFGWYMLLGGGVMALLAYTTFRLYHPKDNMNMRLYALLIGGLGAELMWAFAKTSLGYLVVGFVLAWLWHIAVILVRFHMSSKGIVWKKQRLFLFLSSVGILSVLLFSNWI